MGLGRTTASVNFRTGASTGAQIIKVLEAGCIVSVLEDTGDWLRVQVGDLEGFLHERFVAQDGQAVTADSLAVQPNEPLVPPPDQQIAPGTGATAAERLVARTWNRVGGLLSTLGRDLKIEPAAAVAVFCVESGGRGFASDGRMIIRFENHHFHRYWGKLHSDVFNLHFRFNTARRWLGHEWRSSPTSRFRAVHQNQNSEWAVFDFARKVDDTAAELSISMGGPQIMGSNYAEAGFESVHEMFESFSNSERRQIIAFFDFLKGNDSHPPRVRALQRLDFVRFAELYNGPGQAAEYGARISGLFEAFERIRRQASIT